MNNNAPKTKCPECGSKLQLNRSSMLGDYPDTNEASRGDISLHLVCSDQNEESCNYDCFDRFTFRIRLDKNHPTPMGSEFGANYE